MTVRIARVQIKPVFENMIRHWWGIERAAIIENGMLINAVFKATSEWGNYERVY